MKHDETIIALRTIDSRLSSILESNSHQIISEAISELETTKQRFDKPKSRMSPISQPLTWGYAISPENSLRFKIADDKGYNVRPDIFCNIQWSKENEPPIARDLVLRIWTPDGNLMCREDWDSERVMEKVTSGEMKERVLLRCHFDLAESSQHGPQHHFQIGGNPQGKEYGWYPKGVHLPRLCHYPLDLILLCELVAANFFPHEYANFKSDPSWKGAVKRAEAHFLSDYFQVCAKTVNDDKADTLLTRLWNVTFD